MEPEKLQTLQAENNQLEAKLTKRNEQYIFDLKKALKAANLTDEQTIVALNEMLPINYFIGLENFLTYTP